MSRTRRGLIPAVAILLLWAASIVFYGALPWHEPAYRHWDLSKYIQMAEAAPGIDVQVERPYAQRLLGPWLAGVLHRASGLSVGGSFRLLSLLAAGLVLAILYRFWRRRGLSEMTALVLVAFFVSNRALYGFALWDYFQLNDWIGLAALVIGLHALYDERRARFTLALLIGVLSREATLALLPVAAVFLHERGRLRREGTWLAGVAAAAVAIVVAVRLAVPGTGGYEFWRAPLWFHEKLFQAKTWFGWLVEAFAPLTWLPLVFRRETRRFVTASPHLLLLVALVYASTLFASDTTRLLAPCTVAFYLLMGRILESRGPRAALRLAGRLLPLALPAALSHLLPAGDRGQVTLPSLVLILVPTLVAAGVGAFWARGAATTVPHPPA